MDNSTLRKMIKDEIKKFTDYSYSKDYGSMEVDASNFFYKNDINKNITSYKNTLAKVESFLASNPNAKKTNAYKEKVGSTRDDVSELIKSVKHSIKDLNDFLLFYKKNNQQWKKEEKEINELLRGERSAEKEERLKQLTGSGSVIGKLFSSLGSYAAADMYDIRNFTEDEINLLKNQIKKIKKEMK